MLLDQTHQPSALIILVANSLDLRNDPAMYYITTATSGIFSRGSGPGRIEDDSTDDWILHFCVHSKHGRNDQIITLKMEQKIVSILRKGSQVNMTKLHKILVDPCSSDFCKIEMSSFLLELQD